MDVVLINVVVIAILVQLPKKSAEGNLLCLKYMYAYEYGIHLVVNSAVLMNKLVSVLRNKDKVELF